MRVFFLISFMVVAFYYRYEVVVHDDQAWWRSLAESALDYSVFFVILVAGTHYVKMVGYLSKRIPRVKYFLLGALSVSWITGYNVTVIFRDIAVATLFVITVLLFVFLGSKLCDEITKTFPLPEKERAKLVDTYPPRRFRDLLVFNTVILFVIFMPYIAKRLIWT